MMTIIVMIILATAIILSLSNSGIIGKANKAKQDSDTASLKEYVNVLKAEWELMSETERTATGASSDVEYVNVKLTSAGYTNKTYSVDGEIYTDLPDIAKQAISKGLTIGDEVEYVVESASEDSESSKNGYDKQTISNVTTFKWRYIGLNDDGDLLIAPDMTVDDIPTITLGDATGYVEGPGELNRLCGVLYSVEGKGTARSINVDDVDKILGYDKTKFGFIAVSTMGEYAKACGYDRACYTDTPNNVSTWKELSTYSINYYYYKKDSSDITNPEAKDLIFYDTAYWLASQEINPSFDETSQGSFFILKWVSSFGVNYGVQAWSGVSPRGGRLVRLGSMGWLPIRNSCYPSSC